MKQQTFFGDDHLLARRSDPQTSKDAAAELVQSGKLGQRQAKALEYVGLYSGSTASEMDVICKRALQKPDLDRPIGKRLRELERMGKIRRGRARRCRVSGRMAETWYLS